LSGINSAGKSTILQSLAIINQTIAVNEWYHEIVLNGENVSLGNASDVINKVTGRRQFKIGINTGTTECIWKMETEDRFAILVPITKILWKEDAQSKEFRIDLEVTLRYLLPGEILKDSNYAEKLTQLLARLTYISAERLGPRELYNIRPYSQYNNVGSHGEWTACFLEHLKDKVPIGGLIRSKVQPTLQRQTEAWLRHFFPGASINISPVQNANMITMGIRTSDSTDFHRPQNVGYGITHTLPIIAACVGADKGDLILIENPEAHLHPFAQAEMGEFLAKCADSGLQIILETHSDHILNGIRRAVKKKIIEHKKVAIHFFTPRKEEDDMTTQVISPLIDSEGNLSEWPENFFDQFDKDTSFLIEWD
jgi:predicted ATPase